MLSEITQALPKKRLLTVNIHRLNDMYLSLLVNLRHLTAFLQAVMIILWMAVVFLLIFCYYVTVLDHGDEIKPDPLMTIRTYGTIVAVIFIVTEMDKLHFVVGLCFYLQLISKLNCFCLKHSCQF